MAVTIIVGAQWGDEGKGKIVDFLASSADMVIRFNGGNNAGHTIKNEFGDFALHLVPAGIFNPDTFCVIERGVVAHLPSLFEELRMLKEHKVSLKKFRLSPYAHLVMPWHIWEEKAMEEAKNSGGVKIGTTLRGIGPCYKDKIGRYEAFRVGELLNKRKFWEKFEAVYRVKKKELRIKYPKFNFPSFEEEKKSYLDAREAVIGFIDDTNKIIKKMVSAKKSILLEGAQGTLLDIDYGTYPYLTSSNTTSMAACMLTGISPKEVNRIIAVAKAYITRVGEGPFPTEIKTKLGEKLRELGKEYGATTGRPRRCGWLDVALLKYACEINHATEIALTKVDILGMLPEVRLSEKYKEPLGFFGDLEEAEPDYKKFEAWGKIENCRFWDELPEKARKYIDRVEKLVAVPIDIISTGGRRKEIILG